MTNNSEYSQIIEEKLEAYKKASTVNEYRIIIAGLNKYHDPRIAEVFWNGLRSKEKENFPLVVFFATVSALEAYDKNTEILDVFIDRWKRDYEQKIVEDLSTHRSIEVIHIIVNEAFQTHRENPALNDLLIQFLEKKILYHNDEGIYKTIDAFKFFPKKIGSQAPQRLLDGLMNITAKYLEQQLLNGKCFKEIREYIDFFTDKIGTEKVIENVKKVERKYKSELFDTFPGEYTSDCEKGEVYARTALHFAYSDEYKRRELCVHGIDEILNQLGSKVLNIFFNIETEDIESEIQEIGIKRFLDNKNSFMLNTLNAKDVLKKLPPMIPAIVIADGNIREVFNARYANNYFMAPDARFTIFGQTVAVETEERDKIDGVIIEIPVNESADDFNAVNEKRVEDLLNSLDSIVSDVSVEVKKLNAEKDDFIQKSRAEEDEIRRDPFLGFRGEKERDNKIRAIKEEIEVYENGKKMEIIRAFKLSFKKKAIEMIEDINSLSFLNDIVKGEDVAGRLAKITGPIAQSAEIIRTSF